MWRRCFFTRRAREQTYVCWAGVRGSSSPPWGERGGAFDSKVNCLGCEFGDCMVLQENWQQVENSCGEGVFSLGGLENKRMYVGQVYVAVVHPPLGGEGRGV